uniref:Uncharacterized protein n=1 Tax=Oryza sativa subsp. japonica TaxID=39947 RepID=Q6ESU5_ORYSJ|nr:hypothetical protein [Oryza sativa Japonica Group]
MGLRDGLSNNKLLDNFGSGRSNSNEIRSPDEIEIIIVNKLIYLTNRRDLRGHEQLNTRVGYGQVHRIIENDLDKCRVIAPNPPTKTDDLSHSTGHGWTTREKVVNG